MSVRAAATFSCLVERGKANKVNVLTWVTYLLENIRNQDITLLLPDEFTVDAVALIG